MDALKALGDHRAHAKQSRALGGPIARGAVAIFGAGEHDERRAFGRVFHRRVVDRHLLAVGEMLGDAAFRHIAGGVLGDEILDADIGEGAAHHHFVIAAPRAVLIEVLWLDALLDADHLPAGLPP